MGSVPSAIRAKIKQEAWLKADSKKYAGLNNYDRAEFMNELWEKHKSVLEKYGVTRTYIKDMVMKGYRSKQSKYLKKIDEHEVADKYAEALIARKAKVYKSKDGSFRYPLGGNLSADLYIIEDVGADKTPKIIEVENLPTWKTGLIQSIVYAALMKIKGTPARGKLIIIADEDELEEVKV